MQLLLLLLLLIYQAFLPFLQSHSFFRGVPGKHIKDVPHGVAADKVSVILYPAHLAVLPDNPVFHIVQVILAVGDLLLNAFFNFVQILRMYKPAKCAACQLLKFFESITAKDTPHGFICVYDPLLLIGLIDKKASRHLIHHLFDLIIPKQALFHFIKLIQCCHQAFLFRLFCVFGQRIPENICPIRPQLPSGKSHDNNLSYFPKKV